MVTSYISEKFLPGILIGYIDELNNDANNLTKSGYITPVVDFRHLQEVLVILETKEYVAPSEDGGIVQTGTVSQPEVSQSEPLTETESETQAQ